MHDMSADIERVLLSERELKDICSALAGRITKTYADTGRELVFVSVLKGSVVFTADLLRRVPLPCALEFMKVSSYGAAAHSSGFIQVHLDLKRSVDGADVVILEDIVDSGRTLQKLSGLLAGRACALCAARRAALPLVFFPRLRRFKVVGRCPTPCHL